MIYFDNEAMMRLVLKQMAEESGCGRRELNYHTVFRLPFDNGSEAIVLDNGRAFMVTQYQGQRRMTLIDDNE